MAETAYSDLSTIAAYVDANVGPVLRANAVMPNLVGLRNLPGPLSDSVKMRHRDTLTATAAAENTNHAISTYGHTETSTLSVAEQKVYVELSSKVTKFGDISPSELAEEFGAAIAQKFDTDAMALFDGASQSVGATGTDVTLAVMGTAAYTVRVGNVPGPYVYVIHETMVQDLQQEILSSSSPVWSQAVNLSIMNMQAPESVSFRGSLFGLDVYGTTNSESINTGADWAGACFSPKHFLGATFAGGFQMDTDKDIRKGVSQFSGTLWYDVKENRDAAGCLIVGDQ